MATIRCAGRSLLRRSPSVFRQAAGGGEGRVLQQQHSSTLPRGFHSLLVDCPAGAMKSSSSMATSPFVVSSSRYMSSWSFQKEMEKDMKKKLAVEVMKEHSWYGLADADKEIGALDELLHLLKTNANPKEKEIKLRLLRGEVEKKKQELAILCLKEDGGEEYKQKMEELAAAVHRLRQALSPYPLGPEIRELRDKYKSLEARHEQAVHWITICGMPVALATLMTFCR